MRALLLRRLLQMVAVAWGVGTLTFMLMRALPGDMAYRIAASRYGQDNVSSYAANQIRQELNLDGSGWSLYLQWLADLVTGNLGRSLINGMPVMDELSSMLAHSLLLAFTAICLSLVLAVPMGVVSARYPWVNHISLLGSAGVRATPLFVIGVVAIILFAIEWPLFPVAGAEGPLNLVLPMMTLAISLAAVSNRIVRDRTHEVINAPFYQFARTKGLSEFRAFYHHGIRNISLPVITFVGVQLVVVIEGMVMIESLFSWPGIGHGLAHAVFARDIPMIQGAALLMGLLFVAMNTLVDIACYLIDPSTKEAA
jgi:peptide/nickel transport system permease protein